MGSDFRQRWKGFSPRFGPELAARVEELTGDDPELVAMALGRLTADERIALHVCYVNEFSVDAAAGFFELGRREFLRLLAGARRRLLEEYARLREGAGVVVALLAGRALRARRRAQAGLARAQGALDQGLARLSHLPVLDACSATVSLALVAALALGAGAPARQAPHASSPSPVALGAVVAVRAEAALARLAVSVSRPAPAPPPPAPARVEGPAPPSPVAAASVAPVARPPLDVGPLSQEAGAEGRTTYHSKTLVEVEYAGPTPPAEDPPGLLPEEPTAGVDAYVGYHCPPPGERPLPQALACPVLEP